MSNIGFYKQTNWPQNEDNQEFSLLKFTYLDFNNKEKKEIQTTKKKIGCVFLGTKVILPERATKSLMSRPLAMKSARRLSTPAAGLGKLPATSVALDSRLSRRPFNTGYGVPPSCNNQLKHHKTNFNKGYLTLELEGP